MVWLCKLCLRKRHLFFHKKGDYASIKIFCYLSYHVLGSWIAAIIILSSLNICHIHMIEEDIEQNNSSYLDSVTKK